MPGPLSESQRTTSQHLPLDRGSQPAAAAASLLGGASARSQLLAESVLCIFWVVPSVGAQLGEALVGAVLASVLQMDLESQHWEGRPSCPLPAPQPWPTPLHPGAQWSAPPPGTSGMDTDHLTDTTGHLVHFQAMSQAASSLRKMNMTH